MKNTKKGFTLVELLVVIAILAILASVAIVGYTSFIDRANQSNTDSEAHQIKTAIESTLVMPNGSYEISEGVVATMGADDIIVISYGDGKHAPKNSRYEFPLDGDFKDLKGHLEVKNNNLVYVADSGKEAVLFEVVVARGDCEYAPATCTDPETCICGAVKAGSVALGHTDANNDHNCDVCKAEGVTEHDFTNGDCACGEPAPADPEG